MLTLTDLPNHLARKLPRYPQLPVTLLGGLGYALVSDLDAAASFYSDFGLDAREQAVFDRRGTGLTDLVHHSDRGTQYLSMRYTERLGEAGIAPSVGSRGDSYDCEDDGGAVRAGLTPATNDFVSWH